MLAEAQGISKIIIVCGRTDLRRGIDGFARIIGSKYELAAYVAIRISSVTQDQNIGTNMCSLFLLVKIHTWQRGKPCQ